MPTLLKLSLNNPCSENWDAMSTVTTGRFCQSCQKTVTDFSQFTDSELMDFFKKRNYQSLCGRIQQHRVNKVYVEIPSSVFKSHIPFWKKFLAICLVAFGSMLFTPENSYSQAVMTVQVVNPKKVKSQKSKKKPKYFKRTKGKFINHSFVIDGDPSSYVMGFLPVRKMLYPVSYDIKEILDLAEREKNNSDTVSAMSIVAKEENDNKGENNQTENNSSPMITTPAFRFSRPGKTKPAFKKK